MQSFWLIINQNDLFLIKYCTRAALSPRGCEKYKLKKGKLWLLLLFGTERFEFKGDDNFNCIVLKHMLMVYYIEKTIVLVYTK